MRTLFLGLAALAVGATAIPATAQPYDGYGYGQRYDRYDHYDRAYGNAWRDGYNRPPQYAYRDYRDQRAYRRCSDGTTGTIIGAIAGGLLGRAIDDRGDHATGTVLGGVGGALVGRSVERNGYNGCSRY